MKISKNFLLLSGVSPFFLQQNSCRDKATTRGYCQNNIRFCGDEWIELSYTYCAATCRTCGKQPPQTSNLTAQQSQLGQQGNVGQQALDSQLAQYGQQTQYGQQGQYGQHGQYQAARTQAELAEAQMAGQAQQGSKYGSMFNGMHIPGNDGRDYFSGRTEKTKSTYRPFPAPESDVANSWHDLQQQNWKESQNIRDWNSKSYFTYRNRNYAKKTKPAFQSPYMNGKQGTNPYDKEDFNAYKSLFHRGTGTENGQTLPVTNQQPAAVVYQEPVYKAPVYQAPVQKIPVQKVPVPKAPVQQPPVAGPPVESSSECEDTAINCQDIIFLCAHDVTVREKYCRKSCNGCVKDMAQTVPIQTVPVQSVLAQSVPVQTVPPVPVRAEMPRLASITVANSQIPSYIVDMANANLPVQNPVAVSVPVQTVPIQPVPVQPVPVQTVPVRPVPVQTVPIQPVQLTLAPTPAPPLAPLLKPTPTGYRYIPATTVKPVAKPAAPCVDQATECSLITLEMCAQPFMGNMVRKCPKTCGTCGGAAPPAPSNERVASIVAPAPTSAPVCADSTESDMCKKVKEKGAANKQILDLFCKSQSVWMNCPLTCDKCDEVAALPSCMDTMPNCSSDKISKEELCANPALKMACKKTCGVCSDAPVTTATPTTTAVLTTMYPRADLDSMFMDKIRTFGSSAPVSNPIALEPVYQPVEPVVYQPVEQPVAVEQYMPISQATNERLASIPVANSQIPSYIVDMAQASLPVQNPVAVPVAVPVDEPVVGPVYVPVAAPVAAPVAVPVAAPVAEPVVGPVYVPVAAPVAAPVSMPVAVFDVPSAGCKDLYPELCKLKANAETCQSQNLWSKCGASCNRCAETSHLIYECKDMNEMCQTGLMSISCPNEKWIRESCPITCRATSEFCVNSAPEEPVVESADAFKPAKDMSPLCASTWKKMCHIPMFGKACPVSCPATT